MDIYIEGNCATTEYRWPDIGHLIFSSGDSPRKVHSPCHAAVASAMHDLELGSPKIARARDLKSARRWVADPVSADRPDTRVDPRHVVVGIVWWIQDAYSSTKLTCKG